MMLTLAIGHAGGGRLDAAAKLITAMGTLMGVLVWPSCVLIIAILFRKEFRSAASRLPAMLDRITKMKIAGMEAELDRVADATVDNGGNSEGSVTAEQARTAARIEVTAKEVGVELVLQELDRLCLEYDALRRAMPPSRQRTEAMTRVLVKMRSLGPSAADHIDAYKSSGSAGSRLAAVAIMQMLPEKADIPWLQQRFASERPFVFYHAALTLQNLASAAAPVQRDSIKTVAKAALAQLGSFGEAADKNTVQVLSHIIAS